MSVGRQPREIADERIVLDGRTLRVFVRSNVSFFRAELTDDLGNVAKVAPVLRVGEEHSCALDLGAIADGRFTIVLRSSDGSALAFGRSIAGRARPLGDLQSPAPGVALR